MFEQSILIDHAGKKRLSVFISLSAQVFLVGIALTVPLMFNDSLLQVHWPVTLSAPVPPSPPIPEVQAARSPRSSAPARIHSGIFAPPRIPERIISIDDATPTTVLSPPSAAGVPFSIGTPGAASALVDGLIRRSAAPPPVMARTPDSPPAPLLQGGRVQAAKLIKQVIPQYPGLAKQARISGTVRLQGLIARDGTIKDLQLISGHPLLVQAAIDAVRHWIYRPTTLNGAGR